MKIWSPYFNSFYMFPGIYVLYYTKLVFVSTGHNTNSRIQSKRSIYLKKKQEKKRPFWLQNYMFFSSVIYRRSKIKKEKKKKKRKKRRRNHHLENQGN